jgi:hypothetical protein
MKPFARIAKFIYAGFFGLDVFVVFNLSSCSSPSGVKSDGVYQHIEGVESYYLRFYADGTVISVTASATPQQVAKWFDKSFKDVSTGQYTVTDKHIKFSSTDSHGTVDYEGDIQGDNLALTTFSHINNAKGNEVYKFVEN